MSKSLNLANEVEDYSLAPSNSYIKFKCGSVVKVVTASDSARSTRAHWIIADEFVQIKKEVLDKVIRKFKAGQRTPGFYSKPEYKNVPKEPNTETYISSAYYKWHYSWAKFKGFVKSMLMGDNYFALGFPYQLPVSEGYYPIEQVQDEMAEADFDSIAWNMEMDSIFWGESANAFFTFGDVDSGRRIMAPIYPMPYYSLLADPKFRPPNKQNGEIRILAMDVAAMGGIKNDASSVCMI